MIELSNRTEDLAPRSENSNSHPSNDNANKQANNVSSDSTSNGLAGPEEEAIIPRATYLQAYLLGMAMKLGGATVAWNYGLAVGFWEYFIAVFWVGMGYLMLGLCMAEMVSIMTFDGGYYGYARVILGPLGGFLVGCSGLMESIFYSGAYTLKIAEFFEVIFDINTKYDPYFWLGVYVFLFLSVVLMTRYFWQIISVYTIGTIIMFCIFLFGSMPAMDFQEYALKNTPDGFKDDPILFLDIFRLSIVFFMGFDLLTLTSSEVKESKKSMPYAVFSVILTVFILALWLMFTVASQPPGVVNELTKMRTYFPLVFGYMRIFRLGYKQAVVIAGFPMFGTSISYIYVIGKQVKAMASSGLLPPIFNYTMTLQGQKIPVMAYLGICVAAYGANYFAFWVNIYTTSTRVATISGSVVYLSMFVCYILFKNRFGHMEKSFHNPLGIYSAALGMLIFSAMFIIMIAFHPEFKAVTIMYFMYMVVCLVYYYVYVEPRQFFSLSEQKVFFKAYIMNLQLRKRKTASQRFFNDVYKLLSEAYTFICCLDPSRQSLTIHPANKDKQSAQPTKKASSTPTSASGTRVATEIERTMDLRTMPVHVESEKEGNMELFESAKGYQDLIRDDDEVDNTLRL